MIVNFNYSYFALVCPFIIIWIIFFIFSKKTRTEQLIMSFLFFGIGIISENLFYFHDYWSPGSILSFNIGSWHILLEDILFSFAIAGIGSVAYEIFLNKRLESPRKINLTNFIFKLLPIIVLGFFSFYLFLFLGVNSIFATSFGFIILSIFIIRKRRDLLFCSLFSGLSVMIIMFFSYFTIHFLITNAEELIEKGWMLHNSLWGMRFLGIPITEMIWGFTAGAFIGLLYKFITNIKFSKPSNKF
ncbi:MAG: lycopene cyclase domain-containing protein [Patescibacteria group bacterium]